MNRTLIFMAIALNLLTATSVTAQGGQGGGFGGGGGFQGGQGGQAGSGNNRYDSRVREIEAHIDGYFQEPEIRNILTPGEFSEWKLTLKAGQVVVADARSDAFDPAIEIVDAKGKVLGSNDDRFPGDQRPLLFWRCTKDGEYALHARCFRDKSGGQFFLRLATFDSLDLGGAQSGVFETQGRTPFLVRVPMKAGQLRIVRSVVENNEYAGFQVRSTIAPNGLPDIGLADRVSMTVDGFLTMAPVDGDYYLLAYPYGGRPKVKATVHDLPISTPGRVGQGYQATGKADAPSIWKIELKAGEVLRASVPSLDYGAALVVAEAPDVSKYKLDESENNPFFPKPVKPDEKPETSPIQELEARARDQRYAVFVVKRDTSVWIASNGSGAPNSEYVLDVSPATTDFPTAAAESGKLKIGHYDYWSFDAKAGDVMTFAASVAGFAAALKVYDPDLMVVWNAGAMPDQTTFDWSMVARKPGRYLVAVSAIGDGGAGDYSLSRQVFSAQTFGKNSPARGDFSSGRAEVWKVTLTPGDPALLHWTSDQWGYSITICDENGRDVALPRTSVDANNQYGIIHVTTPQTYVIVLVSNGSKVGYSIELSDLPGLTKKG